MVGIDGLEFERKDLVLKLENPGAKIVDFAGLGGEGRERDVLRKRLEHRLPTGAQMVLAGIDGKGEVGVGTAGADPSAVKTDANGRIAELIGRLLEDLNDVDQGFSGFGLRNVMLGFVGSCVKLKVHGAASRASRSGRWLLGKDGSRENEESELEQCFHGAPFAAGEARNLAVSFPSVHAYDSLTPNCH